MLSTKIPRYLVLNGSKNLPSKPRYPEIIGGGGSERISTTFPHAQSRCMEKLQATGDTGCKDNAVDRSPILKTSKRLKIATWNCGGLYDTPDAGVTVGEAPNRFRIRALEYADDAGFVDNNAYKASKRLSSVSRGSREEAAMIISVPKTKAMF